MLLEQVTYIFRSDKKNEDRYILLDGNMRLEALKELKKQDAVLCIISKDDESFTYNKYISRQAPIQDHKMIKRRLKMGFPKKNLPKPSILTSKVLFKNVIYWMVFVMNPF